MMVPALARRLPWVVLPLASLLAGCGEAPGTFCQQAQDYLDFEARFATVTTDPGELEDYMGEWGSRLDDLAEVAPLGTERDIDDVAAGVEVIDGRLEAKDYDILELAVGELDVEGMDQAFNAFQEAMGDECGIGPAAPDPAAPQPFSADEVNELELEEFGSDDLVTLVAEELVASFDLSDDEARCLAEAMDDTDFGRLLAGRPLAEGGSEAFVAAIDACGVDPDQLVPTDAEE